MRLDVDLIISVPEFSYFTLYEPISKLSIYQNFPTVELLLN